MEPGKEFISMKTFERKAQDNGKLSIFNVDAGMETHNEDRLTKIKWRRKTQIWKTQLAVQIKWKVSKCS